MAFQFLLKASLPECCPYPMKGTSEEMEKPKEDLVWIEA